MSAAYVPMGVLLLKNPRQAEGYMKIEDEEGNLHPTHFRNDSIVCWAAPSESGNGSTSAERYPV